MFQRPNCSGIEKQIWPHLNTTALEAYRTALMNANQGSLEARVVPTRAPRPGGG